MQKHYTKVYIPSHIEDRLRKYEQENQIDEAVALIRLVDAGLSKWEKERR